MYSDPMIQAYFFGPTFYETLIKCTIVRAHTEVTKLRKHYLEGPLRTQKKCDIKTSIVALNNFVIGVIDKNYYILIC